MQTAMLPQTSRQLLCTVAYRWTRCIGVA